MALVILEFWEWSYLMSDFSNIEKHLDSNELVLWKGFPQTTNLITIQDVIFIIFGMVSIYGLLTKIEIGGIVFLIIILYLTVGRLFIKYWQKKRTAYYVTSKRIIIFNSARKKIEQEQDVRSVVKLSIRINKKGLGRIEFGKIPYTQFSGGNQGIDFIAKSRFYNFFCKGHSSYDKSATKWIPVFYDIGDVQYVYDLVNSIRNQA